MERRSNKWLRALSLSGVWLSASVALAESTGSLTWGAGPLATITNELSGAAAPVAVVALAAGGVGLMFGRDFGQLAHVATYVALVAGMVGGVANMALGGALVP